MHTHHTTKRSTRLTMEMDSSSQEVHMWSKKYPNHRLCNLCNASVPDTKVKRDGDLFFCDEDCQDKYYDSEQMSLPFASTERKAMNGHKVLRRLS